MLHFAVKIRGVTEPRPSRLLKKGIPMPETVRFRDRLNVESTSCGC
jgi:hypothetical protein